MKLQHLDCTTEERRIQICQEYIVHADDCIVLYGGRTVRSDANNKEIHDRYYQFSCENKVTQKKYVITCGSSAARHLCSLIHEKVPHAMNPFIQESEHGITAGHGNYIEKWNPLRKQLYYAVQLFIIRYQDRLTPGTKIFKILQSIDDEQYIHLEPQIFHYKGFVDIVTGFNTNIPQIIQELGCHGRMRNFNFTKLANKLEEVLPESKNILLFNSGSMSEKN